MASGKQLSFAYGEVSPSLRYKSDAVSYAQGLGKLKNMYVRRAGGISNRPGLEFVKLADSQEAIPVPGGPAGIKGYVFWSPSQNKWVQLQYVKDGAEYKVLMDGGEITTYSLEKLINTTPDKIRFTLTSDSVLMTPPITMESTVDPDDTRDINIAVRDARIEGVTLYPAYIDVEVGSKAFAGSTTITGGSTGVTPFLPVTYLLTANMRDGTELKVKSICTIGHTPGSSAGMSGVVHPHPSMVSNIDVTLSAADPNIKSFSLYRAVGAATGATGVTAIKTGSDIPNLFYKLAGKQIYSGQTAISFTDYGSDDASVTPSIDESMLESSIPPLGVASNCLNRVQAAAYYQQRLLLAVKPDTNGQVKAGTILASKIGAPDQVRSPAIFSNTAAFQFNIPITDGTPCVALLAMERLMAFTERGTYVIRGGEQGVLTPTTVNPLMVSEEGCSSVVEPKMSGRRGYYVNNTHDKIMSIVFGTDGNLEVKEASLYSEHFLYEDIVQLEVIGGSEDTAYLLRRDGKLVRVTSMEDTSGFSLIETDGYIESIYRGKAYKRYSPSIVDDALTYKQHDVLMCYVIRNGMRTLERLNIRDDRNEEGMFFADCYYSFGYRLSDNGVNGYAQTFINPAFPESFSDNGCQINLTTATDWLASSEITVASSLPLSNYGTLVFHFFYDDVNGVEQTIRLILDGDPETVGTAPFDYVQKGYFTDDVPVSLRDVLSQTISTTLKNRAYTRWLPAINSLDLTGEGPAVAAFGDPAVAASGTAEVSMVADGDIISSPLNPNRTPISMVRDGFGDVALTFPDYYCYGYVGIPYTSEFETLDLEASDNRTLTDSKKLLNAVGVGFHETRGGFYGMQGRSLTDMEENYFNEDNLDFSVDTKNYNGHQTIHIPSEWNGPGRINIKQVDPLPMTILAVYPKGISGD